MFIRHIAVPKNENGIKECKSGKYTSENTEVYDIDEDFFYGMWKDGMYQKLNSIEGVMFDDVESDFIPFQVLGKCLEVLHGDKKYKNSIFANAFKAGLNYGLGIYTEF